MDDTKKEFYQKIHFWGRLTLVAGIAASLLFPAYLSFIKGWKPGLSVVAAALVGVAAAVGHTWFNVATLLTYLLIMGPSGTYLAYLTGNVENMRIPSAISGQYAVGAERGTVKAELAGTVAIAASVIVNTTFLIALVVIGAVLVQKLPAGVKASFAYVTPAIFGGVFAQFASMGWAHALASLLVAIPVSIALKLPGYIETPLTVIGSILLGLYLHKRGTGARKDRAERAVT